MNEPVAPRNRYTGPDSAAVAPPLPEGRRCLFLDVDGTLVNFAATPGEVRVDAGLIDLLGSLVQKLQGAVALVSGRPIADLDRMFGPLLLPAAGIHGLERRDFSGTMHRNAPPAEALAPLRETLQALVAGRSGLMLEDKQAALAVHFRLAPRDEALVRQAVADGMGLLAPGFQLLEGDKVFEIKPSSHTKGSAVDAFMQEAPFAGRKPLFFGDDHTDRDGFLAVERHGGWAAAVGDKLAARWRLRDPAAMREWLTAFAGAQGA
jgi:trehalose 6-phosphate phosphatase